MNPTIAMRYISGDMERETIAMRYISGDMEREKEKNVIPVTFE